MFGVSARLDLRRQESPIGLAESNHARLGAHKAVYMPLDCNCLQVYETFYGEAKNTPDCSPLVRTGQKD